MLRDDLYEKQTMKRHTTGGNGDTHSRLNGETHTRGGEKCTMGGERRNTQNSLLKDVTGRDGTHTHKGSYRSGAHLKIGRENFFGCKHFLAKHFFG